MHITTTANRAAIDATIAMLLPPVVLAKLPKLAEVEEEIDPMIHVRLFGLTCGTWNIAAAEPRGDGDVLCYAYVTDMGHDEWGYVALSELAAVRFGSPSVGCPAVERDAYFHPERASACTTWKVRA